MSEGDDRNSERPRWAADEPTAMWDGDALEQQGLDRQTADAKAPPTAPATRPDVGGADPAKVHASPQPAPRASAPAPSSGGLSWPITVGIAIAVAVAVYFLVRAIRG